MATDDGCGKITQGNYPRQDQGRQACRSMQLAFERIDCMPVRHKDDDTAQIGKTRALLLYDSGSRYVQQMRG